MQKSAILTTVGVLEEPLGNARLHVARLVAALLQTSAPSICQELCRLTTMDLLLVLGLSLLLLLIIISLSVMPTIHDHLHNLLSLMHSLDIPLTPLLPLHSLPLGSVL